jgi:hypothetical protein
MRAIRFGIVYCAIVFTAGFVLGTIRTLLLLPRVGERAAELIEAPIMLVIVMLAASRLVRSASPPMPPSAWLAAGLVALGLLLSIELTVVLQLRGLTLTEYVAGRDAVAGTVYLASLGFFALAPWLRARLGVR